MIQQPPHPPPSPALVKAIGSWPKHTPNPVLVRVVSKWPRGIL